MTAKKKLIDAQEASERVKRDALGGQEASERVKRDALGARASRPHSQREALGARASRPHSQREALGARASRPHSPAGWHSRGYHPHFDQPGLIQSLTFRLADSVPELLVQQWCEELQCAGEQKHEEEMRAGGPRTQGRTQESAWAKLRDRIDKYEDAGHGACPLREPKIAAIVEDALLHFDGDRYRLLEWCIMPNHVHVLLETVPAHALGDVVQSWKSFTAKEANRILGRSGGFWMADYYDRYIRDERHLAAARSYIRENPVKARLCGVAEEWRFGSATEERAGGQRTQDDDARRPGCAGVPPALATGEERAGGPRTQDDDRPLRDGGSPKERGST